MLARHLIEQAAHHGRRDALPPVRSLGPDVDDERVADAVREEAGHSDDAVAVARDRDVLGLLERSSQCLGTSPVVPVVRGQVGLGPHPVDSFERAVDRHRHELGGMPFFASAACTRASMSAPSDSMRAAMSSTADPPAASPALPSSERSTRSWIPAASRAPRSSKRRAMSCSSSRSAGRAGAGGAGGGGTASVGSDVETVDRDLEDALGLVDPPEVPLTEREHGDALRQTRPEQRARRLRQQDLPAAPDGADARRSHDVEPDVPLLVHGRLAGVQPDPHADVDLARPRLRCVRALRLDGSGDGISRAREDEEEGVALRVDLDPVASSERVADDPPVRRQHLAVVVAEALEELRRVLDVREDEGDRSAG